MKTAIFGSSFFAATSVALVSSVLVPTAAQAFSIQLGPGSQSSNNTPTGASALVDFTFTQMGNDVEIGLNITNTTGVLPAFGDGATTSKLTGIGFDLGGFQALDALGLSLVGGSFTNTGFLDTLIEDAAFQPFPSLDVGIADNNNFNGGNANGALPEGQSTTASIKVTGTNPLIAGVLENLFLTGFTDGTVDIGARFQQVNAGEGSDKLLGGDPVDDGTIDDGTVDDGTVDDGTVDDGTVDDGTVDDGTVDDGTVDDGTVDDGTVDDGTVDDGTVDDGTVDDGTVDDGTVDDGTVDDGTVDDGTVDDGTVDDGTVDDGTVDDGTVDDGTVDDGSQEIPEPTTIGGLLLALGGLVASRRKSVK